MIEHWTDRLEAALGAYSADLLRQVAARLLKTRNHWPADELIERMAKMNPLERLGTPEDIAASVSFLAGPDGGWINGQVLRANGGIV